MNLFVNRARSDIFPEALTVIFIASKGISSSLAKRVLERVNYDLEHTVFSHMQHRHRNFGMVEGIEIVTDKVADL